MGIHFASINKGVSAQQSSLSVYKELTTVALVQALNLSFLGELFCCKIFVATFYMKFLKVICIRHTIIDISTLLTFILVDKKGRTMLIYSNYFDQY